MHKGKVLGKTEFARNTKNADGLQNWCRKGMRAYCRKYKEKKTGRAVVPRFKD